MTLPNWLESLRAPTAAQFSHGQQRAVLVGFIDANQMAVEYALEQILGHCEPNGDGRLTRVLPLAHPQYPWLFASNVSVTGQSFQGTDSTPQYEAPSLTTYATYQVYRYEITFEPRPYAVIGDENVSMQPLTWVDDTGNNQTTNYANEYIRFLSWDGQPSAEYITAQAGQFKFMATGAAGNNNPNGATVPGQVRLLQNKTTYKTTWHMVPLRYTEPFLRETSYIEDGIGHVNQTEWYGYAPGTLLFAAVSYRPYVPVNPGFNPWYYTAAVSTDKMVDIEFTFTRFNPRTDPTHTPPASSGNKITAGHNLLPWFGSSGRYHYYAENSIGQTALYPSFPFQLLFTDPDAI